MSENDRSCIYNKNHLIQITYQTGETENKNVNLTIVNCKDNLQLKIRDPTEYSFNYTEIIDLGDYEIMRAKQNLDINFSEFKSTVLDLLKQVQKKEMFLKCEVTEQQCTLIFFYKSKIKSIVYLTLDLHLTNQKEVFNELVNNLQSYQDINEKLKKQVCNIKKTVSERDQQIRNLSILKDEMENQFRHNIKQVQDFFSIKSRETEDLLSNKIRLSKQKIDNLVITINTLKAEANFKVDSSARLLKTLENLKLEKSENTVLINQLKNENTALHAVQINQEKNLADLRHILCERDTSIKDLMKKNEELRSDNEKATIIIAQKKAAIDELSKDLVQANQMLVNFNNHYDTKMKQVEELLATLRSKDEILNAERVNYNKVVAEFEEYKATFNKEGQEKLKHDIFLANTKIEELEKTIRKVNKINTLLTDKVNCLTFKSN